MTSASTSLGENRRKATSLATNLNSALVGRAAGDSFAKLNPRRLTDNPVICATWIVALLASASAGLEIYEGGAWGFALQVAIWLWATVLFANFAESIAEGRGKAAAD